MNWIKILLPIILIISIISVSCNEQLLNIVNKVPAIESKTIIECKYGHSYSTTIIKANNQMSMSSVPIFDDKHIPIACRKLEENERNKNINRWSDPSYEFCIQEIDRLFTENVRLKEELEVLEDINKDYIKRVEKCEKGKRK